MEKQLPKGWVETQLIETLETFETGKRPKGGVQGILEGIPSLGGEHLGENGGFKFDKIKFIPKAFVEQMNRGRIFEGDILIVKDGATTGKTSYVDGNFPYDLAFVNEHVYICRVVKILNSKYVSFFLRSKIGNDRILENFTGSAQGGINRKFASNTLIPLPPRAEQDRIVKKVDALMAQHATIQQAMERIPQLLKDFRQQVLTQAVTGKLTEEWRVGKELEEWEETKERKKHREWSLKLPIKWKMLPFNSVANIDSNLIDPNDYLDHVLVAPNHIEKVTGQLLEKVLTSEIKPKSDKHLFNSGSIVYSKIRPYLSKLILADFDGLCSADMYPISSEINIHYLFLYMKSGEFLKFATTAGERSVLPKINQKGLNEIPVPVPPLQEQQEIVRRVESLFEKATAIEQRYEQLKSQIDSLPQAILHKAFKGELVEQLDSDGSAVELLKEIEEMKAKSNSNSNSKSKKSVRV